MSEIIVGNTSDNYIRQLNSKVQELFDESLIANKYVLNIGIDTSKSIQTWLNILTNEECKGLLSNCLQSLEVALLSQTYCLYRNAFSSLRLSLEMLFGGIFFSTTLIDFIEWTNSTKDLNWATINDIDKGVLSPRFYNAFFPELKPNCDIYFTKAKSLYRDLSEYVHGNNHTWSGDSQSLKVDQAEVELFKCCLKNYHEISMFLFCLRYLKGLGKDNLEQVESIVLQTLNHVIPIQNHFTR